MIIIPLGQDCAITFLLQNSKLKKETSLIEWFVSFSLRSIIEMIRKLINGEDIHIFQNGHQVAISDTSISSGHYHVSAYKNMAERRSKRSL